MKEKTVLRAFVIQALIIIGVYILAQMISAMVLSDEYSEPLFYDNLQEEMGVHSADDVDIQFDKEGIVTLKDIYMEDGAVWITLLPGKAGKVSMTVSLKKENANIGSIMTEFIVSPDGTITDKSNGNFSHHRLYLTYIVLLGMELTILLWCSFAISYRKLSYSYHSIFCSGLGIWFALITFLLMVIWFKDWDMSTTYSVLKYASIVFSFAAAPFAVIFGIAMSISNISLIRHEGFQLTNALGIFVSFLLVAGSAFGVFVEILCTKLAASASEVFVLVENIYYTIFAYMECFLIGAILCGTLAALHRPAYDKDYIIILGCKVRPDGTLYPLIRGRVDKAIEFYRQQLEKTGKKAVFVPSGGQGADETLSEAAAMKRYLMEQGIEEEQILIEDQSKNTIQNMSFSRKLIEERTPGAKVAFSTTNYHVFRSGIISRTCDFEPDGMGSKTKWYFWPNAYIREAIGMLYYKWKFVLVTLIPIIAYFVTIQFVY